MFAQTHEAHQILSAIPHIQTFVPLRYLTTYHVGGSAEFFYRAKTAKDLVAILALVRKHHIPSVILGGGSNILFPDGIVHGLVISNELRGLDIQGQRVVVESGFPLMKLIQILISRNLGGMEFMSGIPGTVGGAIRGNAGAYGQYISDYLLSATIIDGGGSMIEMTKDYFDFSYRHSRIKDTKEYILDATFVLPKGERSALTLTMLTTLETRINKLPSGYSCGCFFKNPSREMPASKLIEEAKLKNTRYGGAVISEQHGNYFINIADATQDDIITLTRIAKQKVLEEFGIQLEEEVDVIQKLPQIINPSPTS